MHATVRTTDTSRPGIGSTPPDPRRLPSLRQALTSAGRVSFDHEPHGSSVIARPTKLTPEVQDVIVTAMRRGNYLEDAAVYAGISRRSAFAWMERGRAEQARLDTDETATPNPTEARYLQFLRAVETAERECLVEVVGAWKDSALQDWRAAEKWAARRHADRWGDKTRVEHTGADGEPITFRGLADLIRNSAPESDKA